MMKGFQRLWRSSALAALALFLPAAGCPAQAEAPAAWPSLGDPEHREHHTGKMIWADLVTPGLAEAERFYGGLFGWTFRPVRSGARGSAIALLDGRPVGGLVQRPVPAGEHRQSAWLTYFAVPDADAAERIAIKEGATSLSKPKTHAGRGRQAVLADPEGAVFAALASSTGDPSDVLPIAGEWIWSSLLAHDPARSAAFYQKVFGYEVFDLPEDDGAEHVIFSSDDYARASANAMPSGSRRHPHWLNFVRVADARAAAAKAVALGGRILVEPHTDRHGGQAAVVADPAGAPIGLMEWLEGQPKVESK